MNGPDSQPSLDPENPGPEQPDRSNEKPWLKFAGMGMELAGSTLGMAAIGYLVDRYRGKADGYGTAAGTLIGFAFGMFRFIQKAMREVNDQTK